VEGHVVSFPKRFVYCKPGVSQIRAFRLAVLFTHLCLKFKNVSNSAYWWRQNSLFGQREQFSIRRLRFLCRVDRRRESEWRDPFWHVIDRLTCYFIGLQIFWQHTKNFVAPNWYIYSQRYRMILIKFHMCTWKFWISNPAPRVSFSGKRLCFQRMFQLSGRGVLF
jgi:hypothetical protein